MKTVKSQKYKICGNNFQGICGNPNGISCIKEIRSLMDASLKEAKDAYEGTAPLFFELVKDGSQNSIYNEKRLNDIQNYGGIVTLESTSGVKDPISAKAIEERYRAQAQNALKRYAKKLLNNGDTSNAIQVLQVLHAIELIE